MAKDYIDISPEEGGSKGKKTTVLQQKEWAVIETNPSGLTKEGVEEKIRLWKQSNNKHVLIFWETMLKRCKCLGESGKTPDGKTIFRRNAEGVPVWTEDIPEVESQKPVKEGKNGSK